MANSSGLGHTTGVVEETAFGTAPSLVGIRGYDVDSNGLIPKKTTVQGGGLRGGGFLPRGNRRSIVAFEAAGDIVMDLPTKGAGRLLKQLLGAASIAQVGSTTAFKQTFNLADRRGKSLTIQAGVPDASGNVVPFTFLGCKVTSWEIGVDNQGICKLSMTLDCRDGVTTVAYTAPVYTLAAAANVFSFATGTALLDAVVVDGIRSFTLKGTEPVKTDRFFLNNGGRKSEQLNNGWWDITLTLESEFVSQAQFVDRFYSDAPFGITLFFTGAVIGAGPDQDRFAIKLPSLKIDGDPPTAAGTDMIQHTVTCKVVDDGVNTPIQFEYTSSDTVA